jgi:hypothetical protein
LCERSSVVSPPRSKPKSTSVCKPFAHIALPEISSVYRAGPIRALTARQLTNRHRSKAFDRKA